MNQTPEKNRPEETRPPKKKYQKPAIASEQIFETTALACGKRPGTGGACIGAPRLS